MVRENKSKKKKLENIEYYLCTVEDGRQEVEINLEDQEVSETILRKILKEEFGDGRKRKLFFHSENALLVVGEICWLKEAKKEAKNG